MAFWKMLKRGNDHFEVTRLEPKVSVCEKHYVFDAEQPAGSRRPLSFQASGRCPAYQVPEEIAIAVREKQQRDEVQTAELIRRGTPVVPVRTYADGGMHPVFVAAVKNNQIGVAPQEALFVSTPPGTIPPTVRPPRIPELAEAPIMNGHTPPPTQMAIAEPEPAPAKPAAQSGNLFGSLFSSGGAAKKDNALLDHMARLVGLRSADAAPAKAKAAPAPKPKPAARPTRVASHGAIKPKPAEPALPKPAVAQAEAPVPVRAPAPAPTASAMNGAVPVVPAGSFESRWSTLR
jgi:hypothetical protein